MLLRKIAWFVSVVLCFGLINVSAQEPPPMPKMISGGVVNGKANSLPKPEYPAAARAINAGGAVNVAVTIDEEGNVESAEAVSGHPLLRAAAVAAAKQAKFPTTKLSGTPVKVKGIIIYNFPPSDDKTGDSLKTDEDKQDKVVTAARSEKFIVDENDSETNRTIISGGVVNGNAISLPKPVYPAAARAINAGGAVNVQITIDEDGNVVSAEATSGHPLLRAAAVAAAREAKFNPTLLYEVAVKVRGIIVYNFVPLPGVKPTSDVIEKDSSDESDDTVSVGVLNGKAISLPMPEYSAAARSVGANGAVSVEVVIDETGKVISARAVSGHPLLRDSSEKAALKARFATTEIDGIAKKVKGVIIYNYAY